MSTPRKLDGPPCPKCENPMSRQGQTPAGSKRWVCGGSKVTHGCGYTTVSPTSPPRGPSGRTVERGAPIAKRALASSSRYIITAAQNATPVHAGFLAALKIACEHLSAELIVIPMRYKNATSRWTESQANAEWWAPELVPFLYNQRKKLNPNLVLLGDVKAQPTATRPLSGFEGITGAESCILGHTKLQLKVVPAPSNRFPKILTTTGAVTVKNYTDSKAGKLGEFHHVLGAALVEVRGKTFHLRQILANSGDGSINGSFTDLNVHYTPDGWQKAAPALGLVMGDTHHRFLDPGVRKATFGLDGMVDVLNPEVLVWHDLIDDYATNPHHDGNPFIEAAKRTKDFHLVRREVEEAIAFLDEITVNRQSVIVSSNHDDFLRRWIIKTDWREDVENADFYLDTAKAMLNSARMGKGGAEYASPFDYWVKQLSKNPNVRALGGNESFVLGGNECGSHGHIGPNGARGSILNLSRLGVRMITGHGHTPGREEGHTRVGTSTPLRLEYNGGPSSWLNTHSVVYATGKNSLLTVIGDEWRI